MAGIDKQHEFYICLRRFAFLSSCYRAEDMPEEVNKACDVIQEFYNSDKQIQKRAEMAEEYFEDCAKHRNKFLLHDLVRFLVTEMKE